MRLAGTRWISCRAAVVPAGLAYELDVGGNPLAVLYLEPSAGRAETLAPLVRDTSEVEGALVGMSGEIAPLRDLFERTARGGRSLQCPGRSSRLLRAALAPWAGSAGCARRQASSELLRRPASSGGSRAPGRAFRLAVSAPVCGGDRRSVPPLSLVAQAARGHTRSGQRRELHRGRACSRVFRSSAFLERVPAHVRRAAFGQPAYGAGLDQTFAGARATRDRVGFFSAATAFSMAP